MCRANNDNFSNLLHSYILFVPFETDDEAQSGIVYVWIGSKAAPEESKLIQEIAEEMFNNPWVSLQVNVYILKSQCNVTDTKFFLRS